MKTKNRQPMQSGSRLLFGEGKTDVDSKGPGFLDALRYAFDSQGLPMVLAFALIYLRTLYDDREPRPVRQFLEAAIGSMIVLIVGITCERFGLSSGWSYAAAGFIGTMGVNQVRTMARKWAGKRIDS